MAVYRYVLLYLAAGDIKILEGVFIKVLKTTYVCTDGLKLIQFVNAA